MSNVVKSILFQQYIMHNVKIHTELALFHNNASIILLLYITTDGTN